MKKKSVYEMTYPERSMYECGRQNKITKWRNGIASVFFVAGLLSFIAMVPPEDPEHDATQEPAKTKTEIQEANRKTVDRVLVGSLAGISCFVAAGMIAAKKSR